MISKIIGIEDTNTKYHSEEQKSNTGNKRDHHSTNPTPFLYTPY